jgi:hypothetical protein
MLDSAGSKGEDRGEGILEGKEGETGEGVSEACEGERIREERDVEGRRVA